MRQPPTGWKPGAMGSIVCPHRDLSVCSACASAYPEVVNVYEEFYWIADETERAELQLSITDLAAEESRESPPKVSL